MITPPSYILLHVLTRKTEKLYSELEDQKWASERGIWKDNLWILVVRLRIMHFEKSVLVALNPIFLCKNAGRSLFSRMMRGKIFLFFNAFCNKRILLRKAGDFLESRKTQLVRNTDWWQAIQKVHQKILSSWIETYDFKWNCKTVYNLISAIFPDCKRRSKLRLLQDCVLPDREWTQKLESRNPAAESLLQILDRTNQKRGGRAGSCVEKRR